MRGGPTHGGNFFKTNPLAPTSTAPLTPSTPQGTAMDNWAKSAGFQYLMDQGTNAVNNNAAVGNTLQSGATAQALQKMGMGLASTYQDKYVNYLLDFAKLGLGGASAMSGAGGINNSGSFGSGGSNSASIGGSSGSSVGTSDSSSSSQGTSSGSSNQKNGLIPVLSNAMKSVPSGGIG